MKLSIDLNLECPITPRYIKVKNSNIKLPISKLTEDQLKEVGEAWTKQLIASSKLR